MGLYRGYILCRGQMGAICCTVRVREAGQRTHSGTAHKSVG